MCGSEAVADPHRRCQCQINGEVYRSKCLSKWGEDTYYVARKKKSDCVMAYEETREETKRGLDQKNRGAAAHTGQLRRNGKK